MGVKIRAATIADLHEIQKLNYQLFESDYKFNPALNLDWTFGENGTNYFKKLVDDGNVFVALIDKNIVGYLAGRINIRSSSTTKSLAEIDNMFVLEEYRNQGIGSKLINAFKQYCSENHIEELKVAAFAGNLRALDFYKKNGFCDFEITLKQVLVKNV